MTLLDSEGEMGLWVPVAVTVRCGCRSRSNSSRGDRRGRRGKSSRMVHLPTSGSADRLEVIPAHFH